MAPSPSPSSDIEGTIELSADQKRREASTKHKVEGGGGRGGKSRNFQAPHTGTQRERKRPTDRQRLCLGHYIVLLLCVILRFYPTTNRGTQNGSSVGIYQISASELSRKIIKSTLLVGYSYLPYLNCRKSGLTGERGGGVITAGLHSRCVVCLHCRKLGRELYHSPRERRGEGIGGKG